MMRYMQKIGRSLMLPISVMPIAAILKGIGYWIDPSGFGVNNPMAAILVEGGDVIIDSIPLLFAIGISVGMSENRDSMAVMCTIISFLIVDRLLSRETVALLKGVDINMVPTAFNSTPNELIGMLVGLISTYVYKRFSHINFPKSLSIFGGKRFPIILCSLLMIVFSMILIIIWPCLYDTCIKLGQFISGLGPVGAGIYAFFNRLLIPFGLHYPLNSVFWFDVAGINDIGKFWGTVSGGVYGKTGMYQAGFFPIMMFGLPAVALAIYKSSKPENKRQVGAIMLSAGVASFLTGVTEPIEFSFMMVAPWLYVVHAVLTGFSVFISASLEYLAGFGFSAGAIDYVLSINSPFAKDIHMLLVLGLIFGFVYYVIFRFMIVRYNYLTPGRENDPKVINQTNYKMLIDSDDYDEIAIYLVESLGGRENILHVDSCITRLRIEVKEEKFINESRILDAGVNGVIMVGRNNIQIIVGTKVDFIVDAINDILR